jgi:putative transposase
MTRGLHRYYGAQDLHFITGSCYHREPELGTPQRRDLFLQILEQVRKRYGFVVLGYVVMPEHFHLLISEPEKGTPSTVMQVLKQRFSRRVRRRPSHDSLQATLWTADSEPDPDIWHKRFYDFNVWSERKRIEKLRYMHRNPVKRGLVSQPELWIWSSFRSYAYGETGAVQINQWQVHKLKVRRPALDGSCRHPPFANAQKVGHPRAFLVG